MKLTSKGRILLSMFGLGLCMIGWGVSQPGVVPPIKIVNFPSHTTLDPKSQTGHVTVELFNFHLTSVKVMPLDPEDCGCTLTPEDNWTVIPAFSHGSVEVPVKREEEGSNVSKASLRLLFPSGRKAFVDRDVTLDSSGKTS